MIDFHSHILPRMDDGSKSVEESLKLLAMLAEQGVHRVIATSHFYANEALRKAMPSEAPEILLGAEVRYYQGISHLDRIKELCIQGTDLLLLEMPMSRWTEHTAREVVDLCCRGDLTVVLAHMERYWGLQSQRVRDMIGGGVLMQVNAEYFIRFATRRRALRQLQSGGIHLLGSDCHGLTHRPPAIHKAVAYIRRKRGEDLLQALTAFGEDLLSTADADLH